MAIELIINRIDKGDTKRLVVVVKDESGSAFTPSALTAVFTPPAGDPTSYSLEDFTASGSAYVLRHTFNASGFWSVVVTATDSDGSTEVETGKVYVH